LDIGTRIRTIRQQQGRTLEDVAIACGYSKSLLSKIETGKVVPVIATLSAIAKALNVRVSVLMEDGEDIAAAVTPNMLNRPDAFVATDKGYAILGLAPHFINKKMQPVLIIGQRGQVKPHSVVHDGEEFIIILEGEVKMHVGNQEYTLKKGESIYFRSVNAHGVVPLTERAAYLDIFVE